ncbi:MAG: hypothetical protein IIB45_10230 [Candidatus Marinimicrobia bacterium]|nr:hypothetical protein [Candidatus Neomarinimicrobiota bacterium]
MLKKYWNDACPQKAGNAGIMVPSTFLPSLRWTSVGLLEKYWNEKTVK